MNKIYYTDISEYTDEKSLLNLTEQISGKRKDYILKCKNKGERARRAAVWLLLIHAFSENKINFDESKIKYTKNGKPYCENGEIYFSLSHSGSYAVCAVCDDNVGVDIEQNNRDFSTISKKYPEITSAKEWTKKEACGKLTGKGLTEKTNPDYNYSFFTVNNYTLTVCTEKKLDFTIEQTEIK